MFTPLSCCESNNSRKTMQMAPNTPLRCFACPSMICIMASQVKSCNMPNTHSTMSVKQPRRVPRILPMNNPGNAAYRRGTQAHWCMSHGCKFNSGCKFKILRAKKSPKWGFITVKCLDVSSSPLYVQFLAGPYADHTCGLQCTLLGLVQCRLVNQ